MNICVQKKLEKEFPVTISGFAKDTIDISHLTINQQSFAFDDTNRKQISFERQIFLEHGHHSIEILAENIAGVKAKQSILINIDRQGPKISISDYSLKSDISGQIADESGIVQLIINGKLIPTDDTQYYTFNHFIEDPSKEIMIKGVDGVGNQTILNFTPHNNNSIASNLKASNHFSHIISDNEPTFQFNKRNLPSIFIKNIRDNAISYLEYITAKIQISNYWGIAQLTVNDQKIRNQNISAKLTAFDFPVRLKEGKNSISLRIKDKSGNMIEKKLIVFRKIPLPYQYDQRYRMIIHDFKEMYWFEEESMFQLIQNLFYQKADTQPITAQLFRSNFINTMVQQKRFQVVSRNYEKPAYASLFGNFRLSRNGIEIVARLIDIQTSELLVNKGIVKDAYRGHLNESAFNSMVNELYEKFHNEFPLLKIDNTICSKQKISIDAIDKQVHMNWPVIVYHESEMAGAIGAKCTILGDGFVEQITNDGFQVLSKKLLNDQLKYKVFFR